MCMFLPRLYETESWRLALRPNVHEWALARLGWCLPENTRVARITNGTMFSSNIWPGSQWARVTDRREHKNILTDLLPASSSSMTSSVTDDLGMHILAGLHRPFYQRYSACCHEPLLDHTPVHWALGAFWYMAFQPHLAWVCQRLLDNEDIDAIDRPSRRPDLTPVKDLWDIMYRCIHCCHAAS